MEHSQQPSLVWRGEVDDAELSALHAAAFGHEVEVEPWSERLERHSLGWITAHCGGELVGFCNIVSDGGRHAFLVDTAVHPDRQGTGVGRALVHRAIEECRKSPARYLHVDFEIDLGPFTMTDGLFRRTTAGILEL